MKNPESNLIELTEFRHIELSQHTGNLTAPIDEGWGLIDTWVVREAPFSDGSFKEKLWGLFGRNKSE